MAQPTMFENCQKRTIMKLNGPKLVKIGPTMKQKPKYFLMCLIYQIWRKNSKISNRVFAKNLNFFFSVQMSTLPKNCNNTNCLADSTATVTK